MPTIIPVHDSEAIARVSHLAHEIWIEHYSAFIHPSQIKYMLNLFQSPEAIERQISTENFRYYLVNRFNEDVGYFALVPDNPPPEGVFLSKIYIKSSARKQGLGKVALDFAVTWARLAGGKYLWLTVNKKNTGSFEWYVRQGFTNDSNIVIDIGGGYVMDDHKMTLPVSSLSTPSDDCHR